MGVVSYVCEEQVVWKDISYLQQQQHQNRIYQSREIDATNNKFLQSRHVFLFFQMIFDRPEGFLFISSKCDKITVAILRFPVPKLWKKRNWKPVERRNKTKWKNNIVDGDFRLFWYRANFNGNEQRKYLNDKLLFVFLSFFPWMRLAVNDYSFTHTHVVEVCVRCVWKRVIGTDVNPARRLVTTEVRAHRFINQFANTAPLSRQNPERKSPPKNSLKLTKWIVWWGPAATNFGRRRCT